MGDYAYIVLSAAVALLNIAPLSWQIEHRNSGPVCLGFWVILLNINNFVNAVIWRNDAINRAPAWCDLSGKITLAGPLGLLAANVCVTRFLARVVNPNSQMITARERRNRTIFDYCFSFGIPLAVMATHIVYQPFRFGIARTLGCGFAFVLSWPTLLLWMIWSPILAMIAAMYSSYVMYQLVRHRRNFNKFLVKADSALTSSRFLRLALLSATYSTFTLPLSIYQFVAVYRSDAPIQPYDWATVHRGFYKGAIFYAPLIKKAAFGDYIAIISGILVVIFFGFSSESLAFYRKLVSWWPSRFVFTSRRFRKGPPTTTVCPHSDAQQDTTRAPSEDGLESQKRGDLEKHGLKPLYYGPFADSSHGQANAGLQVAVVRHETIL